MPPGLWATFNLKGWRANPRWSRQWRPSYTGASGTWSKQSEWAFQEATVLPRTLFQQYHLSRSNRKKLGVCSTGSPQRAFLTCTNATWHSSIHCSRSWTPFQRGPLGAGQLYKVQNEPVVISSQPQNHLISFLFCFFVWSWTCAGCDGCHFLHLWLHLPAFHCNNTVCTQSVLQGTDYFTVWLHQQTCALLQTALQPSGLLLIYPFPPGPVVTEVGRAWLRNYPSSPPAFPGFYSILKEAGVIESKWECSTTSLPKLLQGIAAGRLLVPVVVVIPEPGGGHPT